MNNTTKIKHNKKSNLFVVFPFFVLFGLHSSGHSVDRNAHPHRWPRWARSPWAASASVTELRDKWLGPPGGSVVCGFKYRD